MTRRLTIVCDLCRNRRDGCPECEDAEPVTRDELEPPDQYDYGRDAPREE